MEAVRRVGNSRNVSVTITKQKDADDDVRLDFKMEDVEFVHSRTGEVYGELVLAVTAINPSADERIRSVLAAEPGLKIRELISAITATSRAARYHPVTKAAIKMAVGRAVKRGTVVKIDAKYSLSEDAGRCHNLICCLIHLFLGGLLAGFGSIDPAFALVTFLLLLFSSLD